ncbi:hypothetical protein QYM36_001909 [Artemia franciscana]|uniref:Reverse transcriptase domain-containing protein n=1 Tax=Artemia franciscana TaxID=6661 RepID=A0AA88I5Y2_ARTSF|nr:hypothetical protein QYM36_001909 [Artemia franciscana]
MPRMIVYDVTEFEDADSFRIEFLRSNDNVKDMVDHGELLKVVTMLWKDRSRANVVLENSPKLCKCHKCPLVKIGVLEKVDYSDWASPIVPLNKPNSSVRICGVFKATVNPSLNPKKYPMPTAEEIFANLQGGQTFSKLDLNGAYLQIELDDESKELETINTPLGIYCYKRLPFGISESGAIFSENLDNILSGLPATHIVDDILITGKNDSELLENLRSILDKLRDFGIRLKTDKSKGIEPNPRKVEAVMNMPKLRNRDELLSFLGMVNYYRKFIPEMAT